MIFFFKLPTFLDKIYLSENTNDVGKNSNRNLPRKSSNSFSRATFQENDYSTYFQVSNYKILALNFHKS